MGGKPPWRKREKKPLQSDQFGYERKFVGSLSRFRLDFSKECFLIEYIFYLHLSHDTDLHFALAVIGFCSL